MNCGFRVFTALCGGILISAVLPAWAGQNAIAALDASGNGRISRHEVLAAQKKRFHRLDQNHDGTLSKAEFAHAFGQGKHRGKSAKKQADTKTRTVKAWFDNMDSNEDGGISLSEYQAAMTPYFNHLDRNGDGAIDGKELKRTFPKKHGDTR